MDQRHCPSYANRSAVRVLGAAQLQTFAGRQACAGGTWPISAPELPME